MDLGNIPARLAPTPSGLRLRQGTIVSVEVDQATLTVTVAGSTVPVSGVRYATGVIPMPGLGVWLATDGRDMWAIAVLMQTDIVPWGYYVDYTFARAASKPATPTGDIPGAPWYGSPPEGTGPLWMSEGTKTPQGALTGSWSVPVQLTGDAGATGAAAPLVQVQYSQDGSAWYSSPTGSDVYIRTSNDGGATWSAAVRILGPQGPQGASGAAGTNGNYIAVAYKEGARTGIAAPTGNGPVPSGWSGTPIALTDPVNNCLWVSRATCSYTNTLIGSWSAPNQFIFTADFVKANVAMTSPLITGGTFQTAASGARALLGSDGVYNSWLRLWSGYAAETMPGTLEASNDSASTEYGYNLVSPLAGTYDNATYPSKSARLRMRFQTTVIDASGTATNQLAITPDARPALTGSDVMAMLLWECTSYLPSNGTPPVSVISLINTNIALVGGHIVEDAAESGYSECSANYTGSSVSGWRDIVNATYFPSILLYDVKPGDQVHVSSNIRTTGAAWSMGVNVVSDGSLSRRFQSVGLAAGQSGCVSDAVYQFSDAHAVVEIKPVAWTSAAAALTTVGVTGTDSYTWMSAKLERRS